MSKGILQGLKITQAEVLGIQMSPIKGLWEVTINDRGKRGVLYVDFSKNYVLPGPIIEVKTGANKTMEKLGKTQEKQKVDFAKIPLPSPLVMGNPRASQRVVVFTDPDCPFCGKLHVELEKIVQERSDIAFHILLFPSDHAQGCLLEIQEHRLQPFSEDARGGLCPKADSPAGMRNERH